MINVKDITTAVYDRLAANTSLQVLNAVVERSTRINFDPARSPWIGVYPNSVDTQARTASGRQWLDTLEVQVVVQAASFVDDGTEASDALEDAIELVLAELGGGSADLTLGITGVRILGFSREYRYVVFDSDGTGDLFMPQAVIKVKIEARSN